MWNSDFWQCVLRPVVSRILALLQQPRNQKRKSASGELAQQGDGRVSGSNVGHELYYFPQRPTVQDNPGRLLETAKPRRKRGKVGLAGDQYCFISSNTALPLRPPFVSASQADATSRF